MTMQDKNPVFDFENLAANDIEQILRKHHLALTLSEAKKIQTLLGRAPTLAECVLWSIQASEHCSYKSSRIHLKMLPTSAPNVILGPKEDAGVVAVATDAKGHRYGVVMSHESHNHPSQIVPYEGAATGVGGNVRDVCCMGAEVIAVAEGLRFGDLNHPKTHQIDQGVVAGIAGYANPLGVPNLAGDVYYDSAYQENCLVTVVTLGLLCENKLIHSYAPKKAAGYELILVGKPTDHSGFGGASFASLMLNEDEVEQNKGAVQEPNAFLGRHLLKSHYALFKKLAAQNLLNQVGFKDLGAGGIACASVELADGAGYGAEVYLDHVPLAFTGLLPQVILCAETQERYMWVVPPHLTAMILHHYNEEFQLPRVSPGAQASVVGKIRNDGRYIVKYHDLTLVDAKAHDITQGIVYDRPHQPKPKPIELPIKLPPHELKETLLKLIAHDNLASCRSIYECYDKQVQGRTVLERGMAAAGVMTPFNSDEYPPEIRATAIALGLAQNPRYGKLNAYYTAYHAVTSSMRKIAAVGATPAAITDCLCFGNPERPEVMQEIIDAIAGISDACRDIPLYQDQRSPTPVISGNVSLYNETNHEAIPASPMVSCLGVIENVDTMLTPAFKQVNSTLIRLGKYSKNLGGSLYYSLFNLLGSMLPVQNAEAIRAEIYALCELSRQKLILAAEVIDKGGLAYSLMTMSIAGRRGFQLTLETDQPEIMLLSEAGGFVLEVAAHQLAAVIAILTTRQVDYTLIGTTVAEPVLSFARETQITLGEIDSLYSESLRIRRT